jgi:hypothetical protein
MPKLIDTNFSTVYEIQTMNLCIEEPASAMAAVTADSNWPCNNCIRAKGVIVAVIQVFFTCNFTLLDPSF